MFKCAHCGEKTISPLRKLVLGPGMPASCKQCGELSGVTYPAWLTAMIPGSILMIAALFVESESLEFNLNVVGFLLMLAIPFLFLKMQKEEHIE